MTDEEAKRNFISGLAAELNVPLRVVQAVIQGESATGGKKLRALIMKKLGSDGRGVFFCAVWKGSAPLTAANQLPDYDYFGQILEGMNLCLYKVGYTLQLFVANDQIVDLPYFEYILANHPNAGIINLTAAATLELLEACQNYNRPIVFLDHPITEDPSDHYLISMESEPIIEKVVAYLYDLGHRRIAFIRGPVTKQTELDRYKGYMAGLTNLGLEIDNALIGAGNWHELTGKAAAEKFLALASPPTAIIASNDVMAFGAMIAIQEKGLKIPQDISVVGYDNIALASMTDPPLTTVHTPMTQMGIAAAEYMVSLLEGRSPSPRQVYFPLEIVIRGSTGAAPHPQVE
jgi:LacI family transcriptional regulator